MVAAPWARAREHRREHYSLTFDEGRAVVWTDGCRSGRATGASSAPIGRAALALAPSGLAGGAAGVEPMYADEMLADAAKGADLKVVARASQVRAVFDDDSMEAFAKRPKREHVVVLGKR